MFGLEALDVLIGLTAVYLAFGVACTAVVEAVSAWLNVRSSNLEAALKEFLAGNCKQNEQTETFVKAFYDHPLVQALTKDENGRPSYIPPEIVGQVVEALVTANGTATSLVEAVKSLPSGTPEEPNRIKSLLEIFVRQAAEMRLRFARRSRIISTPQWIVEIAQQHLTTAQTIGNPVKASQTEGNITVEQAKKQVATARAALDQAVSDLESAGLQIGWRDFPKTFGEFLTKVAGLLVSIFAVSLGAPFWFDVLQRFMRVRATGAAPGEPK